MDVGQYQYIEQWNNENDLVLPDPENDQFEYKSSRTPDEALGKKISTAASAFWNTGGGIFVAGVDDHGKVDGGILANVGRQSRRDWVDRQVMRTQPPGSYFVNPISLASSLQRDKVVLVIAFGDSPYAHMAYDDKYYVRLGANTQPANHYLVEAIKARKTFQAPILRALLQRSRRKSEVVELSVLVINDAAALDVQIRLEPLPEWLEYHKDKFPLQIPVIDRDHPFNMELYLWGHRTATFGEDPTLLLLFDYKNAIGQERQSEQRIDVSHSIDPMSIGDTDTQTIAKALQGISSQLEAIYKTAESLAKRRK